MKFNYPFKGLTIVLPFLFFSLLPCFTSAQAGCSTGLRNGGFEAWDVPVPGVGFFGSSNGWSSQIEHLIQVWGSGWNDVFAYQGTQFLALNSNGPDILTQDLITTPGATYSWQVAHRGLLGIDVADLGFGPPAGPFTAITMTDGTAWGLYSGTYTVPAGQTTTRVRFVTSPFVCSCANFIDAFDFYTDDCCPDDPNKTDPGICGCGVADTDTDGDGTADCNDGCPEDAGKTAPGLCGCGTADTDTDGDGVADCNDNCINSPNGSQSDSDCDGSGNTCDVCPGGNDAVDNNNDGLPDCHYLPAYADIIAVWKCDNNKVLVAHHTGNGSCHTICISYSAVQAHLNHGDYVGPCDGSNCYDDDYDDEDDLVIPDFHVSPISQADLEVFPNPASDEVNIQLNIQGGAGTIITISDNFGRIILTKPWEENRRNLSIDISDNHFVNGIYYVVASTDKQVLVQRFVISK